MLPVPTDSAAIVEKAFDILEDWARGVTFDSAQVVSERGVVIEEWRLGQGAGERIGRAQRPVIFKGSRYAERIPIGTLASIQSASPAALRRFYRDWYRPDLMAVVAVGDFDPKAIEALITKHFASIPKAANPRPRPVYPIPPNDRPLVAAATDREATSSSVAVLFKRPVEPDGTVAAYRRDLVAQLLDAMLNARFEEITQRPDAPFLGAGSGNGRFLRSLEGYQLGAAVADGGIIRGLEALLVEARRAREFGFTAGELDRQKQDFLRAYERAYDEREKTNSASYVGEYVNHFLQGEPIPGIAAEFDLVKRLLPGITLADVDSLARRLVTDRNRVVLASAPDKAGAGVPTEAALLAAFDRAAKTPVVAYTETLSSDALVTTPPTPGRVVSERRDSAVGLTEWRLSNGVRVLLKPTDFKADELLMTAYSPGGSSLAAERDYMSAALASSIASLGGVGDFSAIDLQKKLAGKAASVAPYISSTEEGFNGRASPKDAETLMQLVYLFGTRPRADSGAYAAFRNQITSVLANRGADPGSVYQDTIQVTLTQHALRGRPVTAATFAEVDQRRALDFYRDRFADFSDFTFVFVGTFDPDSLRPLVERYLGALPATGRTETWKDDGIAPPTGVVERTVRRGVEPQSETRIYYTGTAPYSPQARYELRALAAVLELRLRDQLREQLGGTYSVSVSGGAQRIPVPRYTVTIAYGSAPDRVEQLARAVAANVDSLRTIGPSASDVAKVKEEQRREREVSLKQNAYWLQNIAGRDQSGESLGGLLADYDRMIASLTPEMIRDAARKYLDPANVARFYLRPEK